MEVVVVIVGAGPSGLATSACLNQKSISNIILEKEDCYGSLWRKRSYDRLNLHLGKHFCQLPSLPHSSTTPTFMPKHAFIEYLDAYVSHYNINPLYYRCVQSALYDDTLRKWVVQAKNGLAGETETYISEFLVIATGENSEGYIPKLPGLDRFSGEVIHSSEYKSGRKYQGMNVMVVGCGNSGMEISYDLSNFGAFPSVVVRNPFHVLTKHMVYMGMFLSKYLPATFVDHLIMLLEKLHFGDLSKYGIRRPTRGPFFVKNVTGRSPTIDVGTISKIRKGEIKVVPNIVTIEGKTVAFENGIHGQFDVIVFATGYKSTARYWLKDYQFILDDDGMPQNKWPNHWKGSTAIYCAGFSGKGLPGIAQDAVAIANDIEKVLGNKE
ncbi:FMO-like domain-containing protein [Cephalotus follicularis]|uniref:Flavin-containing monooxygenase n=1 Tax=Cephalotus follicularis TaxID=3775 RepID=A0A1Q3AUR0_CEPFO|nr:FMO-like domain-containing protein [Cephalotus follicularis]